MDRLFITRLTFCAALLAISGQRFFYMAFACCVNVYLVSVHTGST